MVITPGPARSPSRSPAWRRPRRSERAPSWSPSRSRSWARSPVGWAIVRPRRSAPLASHLRLRSQPARRLTLAPLQMPPPRPDREGLVQAQLDAKIDAEAGRGRSARESGRALEHREPTPDSVLKAEEGLGEGSASAAAMVALARARVADSAGDTRACEEALAKARRALGP